MKAPSVLYNVRIQWEDACLVDQESGSHQTLDLPAL